jgi:hypothetical protein
MAELHRREDASWTGHRFTPREALRIPMRGVPRGAHQHDENHSANPDASKGSIRKTCRTVDHLWNGKTRAWQCATAGAMIACSERRSEHRN